MQNPSFFYSLLNIAEAANVAFSKIFSRDFLDHCSLETADSSTVLVTSDQRMMSGFQLSGLATASGTQEFESVMDRILVALRPFLKDKSHTIQFFASRDTDGVDKTLRDASLGSRATLQKLNLNIEDVFDSREENLSKFCAVETLFIALWTHPSCMTPQEIKLDKLNRSKMLYKVPTRKYKNSGQSLLGTISVVRERHDSFVKSVESAMGRNNAGFVLNQLTAHELIREARMAMDKPFTPTNWKACLPGDPIPKMLRGRDDVRDLDISDIQYPPLRWQLFPREARKIRNKYLEMGDKIWAPIYIEVAPQDIEPFSKLFDALNAIGVPWRVSTTIDGGGLSYVSMKAGIASFMVWASSYNKLINESVKAMKESSKSFGINHVRVKFAFSTWAPIGQEELLRSRVSKLAQAVISWGDCEVVEVVGSPVAGVLSTIPFVSHESIGNPSVGPLNHVVRMLPIMRQSSPWKEGSVMYRTIDGKLVPFEPGSSLQNTWNYIFFAPPGSGKSVQIASLLMAAATQPGINEIPRIGIVDIGPSSRGLIRLIQDGLPSDQKHKVAYIRLQNTVEFAINIFDTFPGCRFPTPEQKAMLVNFLTEIATPAERSDSYSSIGQVASQVIDNLYKDKEDSTSGHPNIYQMGVDAEVDLALSKIGYKHKQSTSWWTVTDVLCVANYMRESMLAQRYAVPTLSDVPSASLDHNIADQFSEAKIETTESLNAAFARLILSGTGMYPILSTTTKFDLGEIRIAAIDLDEVAKSGSVSNDKQTALMYLVASLILTKNFKLSKEFAMSANVPLIYRDYLVKRAVDIKESMKWICYDEFHRTKHSLQVQGEVQVMMREGRKFNVGVILGSQSLDDFSAELTELATAVFILMAPTNAVLNNLRSLFGLSETSISLIQRYCTAPTPKGAPMLAHFLLKTGTTDMLLYSTLGSYEMWALSTTSEDSALVERVSERLAKAHPDNFGKLTRMALSKLYPGGVKSIVEQLRRDQNMSDDQNNVFDGLTDKVVSYVETHLTN